MIAESRDERARQIEVCRAKLFFAGAADMIYEELKQIIRSVLQQGLSGQPLMGVRLVAIVFQSVF